MEEGHPVVWLPAARDAPELGDSDTVSVFSPTNRDPANGIQDNELTATTMASEEPGDSGTVSGFSPTNCDPANGK